VAIYFGWSGIPSSYENRKKNFGAILKIWTCCFPIYGHQYLSQFQILGFPNVLDVEHDFLSKKIK